METPIYAACGCCGHYHRVTYWGDCRNDAERFTADALDRKHGENGWTEQEDDNDTQARH
jgi:hypothetical protein